LRLAEGFRDDRRHTGANMSTVGVYIAMKKVHFFLPTFLVFRVSAVALKGFQKQKKSRRTSIPITPMPVFLGSDSERLCYRRVRYLIGPG
jgi:hypothetical protein